MTYESARKLYIALNQLGYLQGVKFAFARAINLATLKPHMESLDKALEVSEDYKLYDLKRVEFVKDFAKKDEKGNPMSEGNQFVIEDQAKFDAAFEEFKKDYEEVIKAREEQLKQYQELLKEEITVELKKVAVEDISETITGSQLEQIMAIVEIDIPSKKQKNP